MFTLLSIAMLLAAAVGAEWVVDGWLGEARRVWVAYAGLALGLLAGAMVKASGFEALSRFLRNAVIGAGIGAALDRLGWKLPWLRRGLRILGIETERGPQEAPHLTGLGMWLLRLGWVGSLVGLGMIWTGAFGG
ncbi:MAG: hypothetical protein JNK19_10535 [Tabrizicola sp.]|nr:hypothetical protein [Tabrizicola sp.]